MKVQAVLNAIHFEQKYTESGKMTPLNSEDYNIRYIVNHFSSFVEISELFFDSVKYSPSLYICLTEVA